MKPQRRELLLAILCGGFVAGTIDIGAACLINWVSPLLILHSIASGLLGKASFSGGVPAAILGLCLQWGMAIIIAAVFAVAARRFPALTRRWLASGAGYGVLIFLVMNYVVVPLSAAPWNPWKRHFSIEKFVENLLAMILFGLIVAFCARSFDARLALKNAENALDAPA
jgi:uncharacterized membrane protein YagU involved in acid resistance